MIYLRGKNETMYSISFKGKKKFLPLQYEYLPAPINEKLETGKVITPVFTDVVYRESELTAESGSS